MLHLGQMVSIFAKTTTISQHVKHTSKTMLVKKDHCRKDIITQRIFNYNFEGQGLWVPVGADYKELRDGGGALQQSFLSLTSPIPINSSNLTQLLQRGSINFVKIFMEDMGLTRDQAK